MSNPDPLAKAEVSIQVDGSIGWLIFDHEARRNAMTLEMWQAVPSLCQELANTPPVRVVVVRGAGERAFVAGADISQFGEQRTPDNAEIYSQATTAASQAILAIPKPVIAMIHGFCIGGGLALALACDIRYAADDCRFGLPPAKLGIGYGIDGIRELVDLVGPSVTKEIIFTADLFDGSTALRWGLLNRVIPKNKLEAFVRKQCATMASRAPLSQEAAKVAVAHTLESGFTTASPAVADIIERCMASRDYQEGVAAFLDKRPPRFEGR